MFMLQKLKKYLFENNKRFNLTALEAYIGPLKPLPAKEPFKPYWLRITSKIKIYAGSAPVIDYLDKYDLPLGYKVAYAPAQYKEFESDFTILNSDGTTERVKWIGREEDENS